MSALHFVNFKSGKLRRMVYRLRKVCASWDSKKIVTQDDVTCGGHLRGMARKILKKTQISNAFSNAFSNAN